MSMLKTAAKGMAWTALSTIIRSVVSFLQVAILTRYLSKEDFGIVAIATLFIGFTQIFLDLGLSVGIMHKHDITSRQYSTLFWLNILCGISLTIVSCSLSPLIAVWYKTEELTPILFILSFTIFASSIGNQHRTVQQKKMRFFYISVIEMIVSVTTLLLAVILAIQGYGIYSLVFSTVYNCLCSNLIFLTIGIYKDRNITFYFNIKEVQDFLKIGMYSIGSQVLDYFSRELDIIVISAFLGKSEVGIYSLCKKLVLSVFGVVNPILMKVLTPILASIHEDIIKVRYYYYEVVETISIVNFPIYLSISVFSFFIISFLYGADYLEATPVLVVLSIYYAIVSTNSPAGCLQTAYGRTDIGFRWTIIRIVSNVICLFIGVQFGIYGVLCSLLIAVTSTYPIFWIMSIKGIIGGDFWLFIKKTFRSGLVCLLVAVPFIFIYNKQTTPHTCILGVCVYLLISFGSILLLCKDSMAIQLIISKFKRNKH